MAVFRKIGTKLYYYYTLINMLGLLLQIYYHYYGCKCRMKKFNGKAVFPVKHGQIEDKSWSQGRK